MKIIVIGYGRVGTQVLKLVGTEKHSVVVIDKSRSAIEKAKGEAGVRVLIGDAVDPDMLRQAGADQADVVLALTREENTNLMAAQIAKVAFKVPRVIAMVYDPMREHSFHAAGIDTLPITVSGAEYVISFMGMPESELSIAADRLRRQTRAAEPAPVRAVRGSGPYYVIIMGGGKVGYYLGRTLLEEGHEVSMVENNPEIFELVSSQLECPVIFGDGSTVGTLEKAGAGRADVFVGVTNHDQDNLIGCQVAKREFGVPKTISRVKNPKNEKIMHQLGVDVTVSSTAIISTLIESELPVHKIRTLLNLHAGDLEIMEYVLDGTSPVVGRQLKELTMPPNCNIVTILRNGTAVVPRGDTAFERDDMVLALTDTPDEPALRKLLLG
jgi:trk system potassium uptake protein TrkA